ncbi:Cof-type HAD-IIB family hydrolase [Paenibacillus pasadenensis]|uniref:HAD-superfamily hydrolase protein n=1 Tax=Paenibacillus pasadenensis TaxID=217090 RepID=A0A2N5NAB0_9BACL|nr:MULTISPECIES: Cof-type HAD-IIB family hydrolase [Paenibacillus]PLT47279.1 HAD-superfamily hydrolase protein [Paenibacillus pasadenensis]QGG57578.1 HAD-IIB family hydrolase [Paenibacillus sp. B01]
MYKLLALDMDGTTLTDTQTISEENAEWIGRAMEAGITVCFSTGRGFQGAIPFAEQLGLETPLITVNGSEIWSRPHVLHRRTLMGAQEIRRLHELAVRHAEPWFWGYAVEGVFNKEKWIEPADGFDRLHWMKFGYHTENDAIRESIRQEIESWGSLEITNSSPWNLELNPLGVNKASALRELCGLLGIAMEEAVAIGDSLNDIAAIRECGLGIAMGNAQDEVKEAADAVTLGNNEHGVAYAIRELVLKGRG